MLPCRIPGHVGRPVEVVAGHAGSNGRRWRARRRAPAPRHVRAPPPPSPSAPRGAATAGTVDRFRLAAHRHHDAALGIELDDHVRSFVDDPDVVLWIDAHRVREDEAVEALADLADELARRIELEQPRGAARERRGACRAWRSGCRSACRRRCFPSSWWPRQRLRPDRGRPAASADRRRRRRSPGSSAARAAGTASSSDRERSRAFECTCHDSSLTVSRRYRVDDGVTGLSRIFCTRHAVISDDDQLVRVAAVDRVHGAELAELLAWLAELADDRAVQLHLVDLAGSRPRAASCCCPGFEFELNRY